MNHTVAHCRAAAVLALSALIFIGCTRQSTAPVAAPITVVPTVETRIVEVTREVEKTVVVTATPIPTPAYASVINAASGTLAYPIASDPASLDPQAAQDEVSELVVAQLYEGLFDLRGDGSTVPAAATAFTASLDSRTYTVTLRSGMTWSDGQPVTARDYVSGVCRLLDPTVGNPYYYLLTEIAAVQGAREFASGDSTDCDKVGVRAADELTLRIVLEQPTSYFPQLLAMPVFWPAAPRPSQAITDTAAGDTLIAAPVVNGPYLLADKVPGKSLTLVKNPSYWNAGEVAVERIEFLVAPDTAKQLKLYEAGDLQVADFPAEETARIEADETFKQELHVLVRPGVSYLGLNTQSGPTADVNVRRAIASAVDRKKLIEEVLQQPWHLPAQTLIPPGVPGYQGEAPEVGIPYDPAAARAALTEAGYGPDRPVPPVELWYNREGNNEAIFKAVGAMLEEVGIPVRLVSSQWSVYRDSLDACNKPNRAGAPKSPAECSYNLYRMGWVMDYADPSALLDIVFAPRSAFQYTGWQSQEYEDLLASARAELDEARRLELYGEAESILLNDLAVVVPLQYYDRTTLVKAAVEFDYPPFGAPRLKYWKTP